MLMKPALPPASPRWLAMSPSIPNDMIQSLREYFGSDPGTGMLLFLEWLSSSKSDPAKALLAYLHSEREAVTAPKVLFLVTNAVAHWLKDAKQAGTWTTATLKRYHAKVRSALVHLGAAKDYPRVSSSQMPFTLPMEPSPYPSLGDLDWHEFEGVPANDRDALGMRMVRTEAMHSFNEYEAIFVFGQGIIKCVEPPEGVEPEYWHALRSMILTEKACRLEHGESQFARPWPTDFLKHSKILATPNALRKAGLSESVGHEQLDETNRFPFLSACLGATLQLTLVTQTIFHCDTGWNRDPVKLLPIDPFLYRTTTGVRLANEEFITNFKKRAGHHILADLHTNAIMRGIAEADCQAIWDELLERPQFAGSVACSAVRSDAELLEIMDRYQVLANETRRYLGDEDEKSTFFLSLILKRGQSVSVGGSDRHRSSTELMRRNKVNSMSIRKTFLNLLARAGATMTEISAFAGHTGSTVTQRHYRMGPRDVADYKASVRFFQGCLQALTMNEEQVARFKLEQESHEWFSKLARSSGIQSACGLVGQMDDEASREDFVFDPTRDNMIDLYLAHKALMDAKTRVSLTVWNVQGVTLLGFILSVRQWIFEKGFGPMFRRVAREARKLLQEGRVSLPAVLEI